MVQELAKDASKGRGKKQVKVILWLAVILLVAGCTEQKLLYATIMLFSIVVLLGTYLHLTDTYGLYKQKVKPTFAYVIQFVVLMALSTFIAMHTGHKILSILFSCAVFMFLIRLWSVRN